MDIPVPISELGEKNKFFKDDLKATGGKVYKVGRIQVFLRGAI